jgi:3-isopropylmalate/(R)-2-methylmalate dehydratase small subunit
MEPFEILDAVAVPLEESNVDTDQICPARLIRAFAQPGAHDDVFLHDRRFDSAGEPRADFILNRPTYAGARILVAQRNFGVGSSREAAVLALKAAGFRCVIAESFGDIFVNNCFQNGVLTVRLDAAEANALRAALHAAPGSRVVVDLPRQTVTGPGGRTAGFAIGALRKRCLLAGLDDLSLTESYGRELAAFEETYRAELPWLTPSPLGDPSHEPGA